MRGLIDADLGGQIIKQRVARPGQGRRGGFRMLLGFRADRAVFLFGFAKNERENIDADQLATLRDIVAPWLAADESKIEQALTDGNLIEVHDGKKAKSPDPKKSPAGKGNARLTRELLEAANDMHASGLLSDAARDKITLRHLGPADVATTLELSGPEIKALRERAQLSQAVFASYLKLTVGYVSKLERGTERPSGPTLVLLDVIRRKELEAIL